MKRYFLTIDEREVRFARRGFESDSPTARLQLEEVGLAFLRGYHRALSVSDDPLELVQSLNEEAPYFQGFAYEGASMALWLLDSLSLGKGRRWPGFLKASSMLEPYTVHVGIGWALARVPWLRSRPEKVLQRLDPVLGWLAIDGYGFHEGYFHHGRWLLNARCRPRLTQAAREVFDQGLGRSLWFVMGGQAERIARAIGQFDVARQENLWSGVGLACTYAGSADEQELGTLARTSGRHLSHLAQGVVFGAEARARAGTVQLSTQTACRVICGIDCEQASRMARESLPRVSEANGSTSAETYRRWRRAVCSEFLQRGQQCA